MKKTITKLMAALALLLFVAPPLVGWGQTYSLYSGQLVEGDYLIYYNGKAMNTTTSSNRLQYNEVTPADDVITTEQTNIVWHIAPDGEYWTIYNASEGLYAVSNGTKNQATTSTTLDDKARWTVTGTSTYEFVNKYNNDNNVNKNLRNNGTYGFACYSTSTGGALSLYKLEESPVGTPSITANNVEIDYNATGGQIEYSINNPVDGGALTAEVTEGEWLENLQVGETVTFNCDPNQAAAPRTATVTLTYTYNTDQTVTKNVTVTQAGNPDVINNIEDITATGAYTVQGTIVAMSTRGFVLGDGTGYVYFYYGANFSSNYTIGDKVKLAGDVSVYGGVYQYTSSATITAVETSNYEAEDPTILSGSDMDARVASTTPPQLSTYVQYVGTLTISGTYYNITGIDGATTAKGSISYPTNTDFTSFLDGKVVTVTGYYVGVSSNQYYNTMIGLIEEVVSMDPSIEANDVEITYDTDADEIEYTINNPVAGGVLTAASQSDWLMVDDQEYTGESGTIAFLCDTNNTTSARTATVTLTYTYGESNITMDVTVTQAAAPQPSLTVTPATVNAPVEGADGTLAITYENIPELISFDYYFCDAEGNELQETPDWIDAEIQEENENYSVYYIIDANEGEARSAYFKVYAMDDETNLVYSNLVTVNQEAYVAPATEGWVLANLSDLTENDVFVIVGNNGSNYAMPNNNGTSGAPAAIKVTVENEALTGNVPDSIQWNIGITDDGYVFYPNGQTEAWLYCTDTNKGVCVGTNDAKVFSLDEETGYLKHNGTGRYIGIYNSQDWRCYTSINNNIKDQTFTFYKKVVEPETYTLNITGYGQSEGGYSLIASPVYVKPETTGMTEGDFDLYYFDQSEVGYEWRNFEVEEGQFNLIPGKGYLYASQESTTLTFTGAPYSGDGSVSLVKDDNAVWSGWNLVGNPFGTTAYLDRDFYAMNEDGTEIMTDASQGAVAAMQGIFVIAENNGETLTFTTETPAQEEANVTLNLTQSRGTVIDRAIVRFGEGRQLPKFQLNTESTKLYIPQSNKDYAVVRSAAQGEMPVNFKASKNGSYTLAIDAENVEMNYLHLIDNMTGADVDLLATPSYTFDAKTTDYASRFKLVFSANANENDDENETFAFFNGSVWCISNTGEATLQVVDMLGRIVSSESVNGNATLSTDNLMSGVYMFRLVNGENVKVQKVVVK